MRLAALITASAFLITCAAQADSLGSAIGGTAANQSSLGGCKYNATPPTLTDGQQVAVQCDVNGNVKTSSSGGGGTSAVNITQVGGNAVTTTVPVSGTVTTSSSVGSTFAPAQVTLSSASATQVLATLFTPNGRNVCNNDTAINIFIGPTGVTTATGIKLLPGACWDASHTSAAIFAIAATGTPVASGVQY